MLQSLLWCTHIAREQKERERACTKRYDRLKPSSVLGQRTNLQTFKPLNCICFAGFLAKKLHIVATCFEFQVFSTVRQLYCTFKWLEQSVSVQVLMENSERWSGEVYLATQAWHYAKKQCRLSEQWTLVMSKCVVVLNKNTNLLYWGLLQVIVKKF